MTRREDAHRRIQAEIAGEKAAALGRAGERLEGALREVALWAARLRAADERAHAGGAAENRGDACDGTRRAERTRRAALAQSYDDARARALQARLTLLIQREALGLRRHAVVDQQFPEPPPSSRLLTAQP